MPSRNTAFLASCIEYADLPFTLRPVASAGEFAQVLALRHLAYSRHAGYHDDFKESLLSPDVQDLSTFSTVFVAVSKTDKRVVGTIRITSSRDVQGLLPAEVPSDVCSQGAFAFIDRFATAPKVSVEVAAALMKSVWLWSQGRDARWMVALANAALARRYRRWGGLDVRAGGQPVFIPEDLTEPIYLVGAEVTTALTQMERRNPQFSAFLKTVHPDINVAGPAPSLSPYFFSAMQSANASVSGALAA